MVLHDSDSKLHTLRQRWLDAQTRRLDTQKAEHKLPQQATTREAREQEERRYAEYAAARDQEELRQQRDN